MSSTSTNNIKELKNTTPALLLRAARYIIHSSQTLAMVCALLLIAASGFAQGDARVNARMDATKIMTGDEARLFIEVQHNSASGRVEWAAIPDTFNSLEVKEKGKIDTLKQGQITTYRQRLLITGFDSGIFKIPAFTFAVIPNGGTPYTMQTDSFSLLVQSVAVDTTKSFKPIKGILLVKSTWMDYLLYIVGAVILVGLTIFIVLYFVKNKKVAAPKPQGKVETLTEVTLRLLAELEAKQLWQKKQIKEYYVELTDIVRNYIEARFHTPALELTTDELLYKAQLHKELMPYHGMLSAILYTADLAKFAKAQPMPQEHVDAMEQAKEFVSRSKPVIIVQTIKTDKDNTN